MTVPSAPTLRTMARGLISTRSASLSMSALNTPRAMPRGLLPAVAEAHRERDLARLVVEQAQVRMGEHGHDGSGLVSATCSISTPPSAEPIIRMRCAVRSRTAAR